MMHVIHRAGRALLALALALSLLSAPVAWASPGVTTDPGGWFTQLWNQLTAWLVPADSGPGMDPSGFKTTTEQDATTTTTEPWEPAPVDPGTTDASGEEDDRGPGMDPSG